jgi:hypothetical protein
VRRSSFGLVLLGLIAIEPAAAQTVPEIRDVYSGTRPASDLGPAVTPQRVLDEGGARLGAATIIRYEASVVGDGDVSGTVLLGKGGAGPFDRFRATIRGRTSDGENVLGVVGSDGRRFFFVNLREKTVSECEGWEELGAIGALARDLLLPELDDGRHPFKFPSPEPVGEETCYVVHFPDEQTGEHLYVSLSIDDGLPRRVERVRSGSGGRPATVTLEVSDLTLDPPPSAGAFEPFAPEGFRRLK